MKKLLLGILFVSACTLSALAQEATPAPAPAAQPTEEMQPIAASELPAAVRTSLEGQDYSGWTVSNSYKKEKDGQTFYVVELKNGAETKKVKFDAEGNKMKDKKDKSVQ